MKKRVFTNKPDVNKRGQYVFYDDNASDYLDCDGVAPFFDKFADNDLYTIQEGHELNEAIVAANLRYPAQSFIGIDKLVIKNGGVRHDIKDNLVHIYLFDSNSLAGDDLINTLGNSSYNEIKGPVLRTARTIYKRTWSSS